ncbi:MAG: hypothetical protein HDT50_03130 [Lactobacillus sp.]|nr:hypothetical protein [Lactobacillus sp.]
MNYKKKKQALIRYRKEHKKRLLLASGVTLMTLSAGLTLAPAVHADETAVVSQTQQQTAESTQSVAKQETTTTNDTQGEQTTSSKDATTTANKTTADASVVNTTTTTTQNSEDSSVANTTASDATSETAKTLETTTAQDTTAQVDSATSATTDTNATVATTQATATQGDTATTSEAEQNVTTTTQQSTTDTNATSSAATSSTTTSAQTAVLQALFAKAATVDNITIGDSTYTRGDAVDVSSYQSWMTQDDFYKLKELGVNSVIVKITEGQSYTNPAAAKQIAYAKNAGLNIAVYHYATFNTTSTGYAEGSYAAEVMANLGLDQNTLIFADMEDTSTYSVNAKANLESFWSALNAAGFTDHGVYTYSSYLYRDAVISTVGREKTWIAQYPYSPVSGGSYETQWRDAGYGAWQFSSTAYIPGRENMGALDLSIDFTGLFASATTVQAQNRNEGYFDQISLNNDNEFTVTGWHAADASETQKYAYIILYDKTAGRELSRIAYTSSYRQDVATSYAKDIYNAGNSGFDVTFSLAGMNVTGHELQVVARYSDSVNGEGNYTDLWSSVYVVPKKEAGYFDDISISGSELHVSGWHATDRDLTNATANIQIVDATTGKVLKTVTYTPTARPDVVKNGYSSYKNAATSGFDLKIPLAGVDISNIKVVANYVLSSGLTVSVTSKTYKFTANAGYFDNIVLNGNQLTVSGWHAADQATTKSNAFLIVYDKTAKREITRVAYTPVARPDVATSFASGIYNANVSGFTNINISLGNYDISGHEIQVVARYSNSTTGEGSYTDVWSTATVLAKKDVSYFDDVRIIGDSLYVSGWHVSDRVTANTVASVQLVDSTTGKVLKTVSYTPTARPDVAKNGYSSYKNATNSGFQVYIPVSGIDLSKVKVVVNYTTNGYTTSGTSSDYSFTKNAGYLDKVYVDTNKVLHVSGWHASDLATTRPYAFIIAYDNTTKKEIARASYTAIARPDVAASSIAKNIYNANQSGFSDVKLDLSSAIQGHDIQIITRFTDDPQGNGNYIDIWYPLSKK